MRHLDPKRLFALNKNNSELIQLLSPDINAKNQELFYKISKNQKAFNDQLETKGIELLNKSYKELSDKLEKIKSEVSVLIKNEDIKKTRLDFDIAKIFHENLKIPRSAIINYEFWRAITLFYFIELTKWRWEKNPDNSNNWYSNAKAIFGRALGLTHRTTNQNSDEIKKYTTRNKRIECYRYWWIADKLYDYHKGYYYIEKVAEKFKEKEGSIQDFLNLLEGNRLLSPNDRVSKILAEAILLSEVKFSEKDARDCFTRYNAYKNRLFMIAEPITIRKEICLLEN